MHKYYIVFVYLCMASCLSNNETESYFKALCQSDEHDFFATEYMAKHEQNTVIINNTPYNPKENLALHAKDELSRAIYKSRKETYFDFYSSAIDSLFRVYRDKKNSPHYRTILELYISDNIDNYVLYDEILNILNLNLEPLKFDTYQDIFFTSKFLEQKASIFYKQNKLRESLSLLHMMLYMVMNSDKVKNLGAIKNRAINKITRYMMKEVRSEQYNEIVDFHFNRRHKAKKLGFEESMSRYYRYESNVSTNKDSIIHYLYKASGLAKKPKQKYALYFNLGHKYQSINSDSTKYYYNLAYDLFSKPSCCIEKYYVLIYMLDFVEDPKERARIRSQFDDVNMCDQATIDRINFLKYQYINPKKDFTDIDTIITKILEERRLSKRIFPGESTLHLQDYYAQNCSKVVESIMNQNKFVPQNIGQTVVNLFYDTKIHEKYRATKARHFTGDAVDVMPEADNIYKDINYKLHYLNDFKAQKPYNDPAYMELYQMYRKKGIVERNDKDKKLTFSTVDLTNILNKLEHQNHMCIEIMAYQNKYYLYTITQNKFLVGSFDKNRVDSLGTLVKQNIIGKKDCSEQIKQIREIVYKAIDLNNVSDVTIIPDGFFGLLPLELIFDQFQSLTRYSSTFNWLKAEPSTVSRNKMTMACYSDNSTLRSRNKRTFAELPLGYEESKSIVSLLGLSDDQMISGSRMTKESLLELKRTDMLHISSHASSNYSNRLDNYLVVRDDEGDESKLYSYEINKIVEAPRVVCISACESGIGVHEYGAGVFSLARAFIDNGSEAVIKTLWKVNENATKTFMESLYTNWNKGLTIHRALERTKLEFQNHAEFSDPYYWAGFVLEGNPNINLTE